LPDVSRLFVLQTDESNSVLGAILLQEDDYRIKKHIAFVSRKLLSREEHYSTIERECFAIVWSVTKFQESLYGTEFIVETDHHPLQYLGKAQFRNGRLMRWAVAWQPYRFLLKAVHGRENVGADCLIATNWRILFSREIDLVFLAFSLRRLCVHYENATFI